MANTERKVESMSSSCTMEFIFHTNTIQFICSILWYHSVSGRTQNERPRELQSVRKGRIEVPSKGADMLPACKKDTALWAVSFLRSCPCRLMLLIRRPVGYPSEALIVRNGQKRCRPCLQAWGWSLKASTCGNFHNLWKMPYIPDIHTTDIADTDNAYLERAIMALLPDIGFAMPISTRQLIIGGFRWHTLSQQFDGADHAFLS